MSSAFDPSGGRAIPEDQVTEDGLELDEDPARGIDFEVEVVSGAGADPTALFLPPAVSPVAVWPAVSPVAASPAPEADTEQD